MRIEKSDRIVMIGTRPYRRKYENKDPGTGYVVAAEVDLIDNRLLGAEQQKRKRDSGAPGRRQNKLPAAAVAWPRVRRFPWRTARISQSAFDLILSLYQIPPKRSRRG